MSDFDPYKVLGIRRHAGAKRIKKAFRDRSKETHPDLGGNPDAFMAVRRAYFILSDTERRKKYDRDGTLDEMTDLSTESKVAAVMVNLFEQLIGQGAAARKDVDLIGAMRKAATVHADKVAKERVKAKSALDALKGLHKRISRSDDGANLFGAVLDRQFSEIGAQVAKMDDVVAIHRAAATELSAYTCMTEVVRQATFMATFGSSTTSASTGTGW